MWIEIFRTGSYQTEDGDPKVFTQADLDAMVAQFENNQYDVPLVFGSAENPSPPWGYVQSLKRVGNTLYAEFRDLVPEVEEMLKNKAFRRRSILLSSWGALAKVGLPGDPRPPALAKLDDFEFTEDQRGYITEFSDSGKPMQLVEFTESSLSGIKPSEKLEVLVGKKLLERPCLSYSGAFSEVQAENHDLTTSYQKEIKP